MAVSLLVALAVAGLELGGLRPAEWTGAAPLTWLQAMRLLPCAGPSQRRCTPGHLIGLMC